MTRSRRWAKASTATASRAGGWRAVLLLMCAAAFSAPPCLADVGRASTVVTGMAGGGPLSASAQLSFRITVLPALGLRSAASGPWQVQSNSGSLVVQGATVAGVVPGASGPAPGRQAVRARGTVEVIALQPELDAAGRARITVASP